MKPFFKVIILFMMSLLFWGCKDESSKEKVGLYAYNMQYACDCPQYKIFQVDNLKDNSSKLKDQTRPIDILTTDKWLAERIKLAMGIDDSGSELIGRDIDFIFKNPAMEKMFFDEMSDSPICYIYYTEGFFQDKKTFLVEGYKLILKAPNCIHKIEDIDIENSTFE